MTKWQDWILSVLSCYFDSATQTWKGSLEVRGPIDVMTELEKTPDAYVDLITTNVVQIIQPVDRCPILEYRSCAADEYDHNEDEEEEDDDDDAHALQQRKISTRLTAGAASAAVSAVSAVSAPFPSSRHPPKEPSCKDSKR
jgi:hypothetical protein